jgi:hypothetical protein
MMGWRSGRPSSPAVAMWWQLAIVLASYCVLTTGLPASGPFANLDPKKWELGVAGKASSAAKSFLEQSGQSLVVPMHVEVFLIGFDGTGGYAHTLDTAQVLSLLHSGLNQHCPHSLETDEELGVCFQINYQALGKDDLADEVRGRERGGRRLH